MNEIIKEFAEQCTKIKENPFGMDFVVFDKEKFAELIIKECQRACDTYINDCGEVNGVPDSVFNSHFGVE